MESSLSSVVRAKRLNKPFPYADPEGTAPLTTQHSFPSRISGYFASSVQDDVHGRVSSSSPHFYAVVTLFFLPKRDHSIR